MRIFVMGIMKLFNKKEIKTKQETIPLYKSKELLPNDLNTLNLMLDYYLNQTVYKEYRIICDIAGKIVELDKDEMYFSAYYALGHYSILESDKAYYLNKYYELVFFKQTDLYELGKTLYEYFDDAYCDLVKIFKLCEKRVLNNKEDVVGMCLYKAVYEVYILDAFRFINNVKTAFDYMKIINRPYAYFWLGLYYILDNGNPEVGLKYVYKGARNDDPFAIAYVLYNLNHKSQLVLNSEPTQKYWNSKLSIVLNKMKEELMVITQHDINKASNVRINMVTSAKNIFKDNYLKTIKQCDELYFKSNEYERRVYSDFCACIEDYEDDIEMKKLLLENNLHYLQLLFEEESDKGALYYYTKGSHINLPTASNVGVKTCLELLKKSIDMGNKYAYMPIIEYYLSRDVSLAKRYCIRAMNLGILEAIIYYVCLTYNSDDKREQTSHYFWFEIMTSINDISKDDAVKYMRAFDFSTKYISEYLALFAPVIDGVYNMFGYDSSDDINDIVNDLYETN